MSERSSHLLITDIIEAIEKIELYTKNISQDFFLNDVKSHHQINWREIKDFRNKLIHEYFGVNPIIVWTIIQNDLPSVKKQLIDLQTSFFN